MDGVVIGLVEMFLLLLFVYLLLFDGGESGDRGHHGQGCPYRYRVEVARSGARMTTGYEH